MDVYHAPFTPKHRYWVGLLVFTLIVHNIVAAMASDTFLPILSAGSLSVGLISLKLFGNKVYKTHFTDSLETLFLLNLAVFAYGRFYLGDIMNGQQTLATLSTTFAFILFLVIICFHIYQYILLKMSIWPVVTYLMSRLKNSVIKLRQTDEVYELVAQVDVQMNSDEIVQTSDFTNKGSVTVDLNGGETNSGQIYAPSREVSITRADQLREPDMDELAPLSAEDYQTACVASDSDPCLLKQQKVTHTIVEPIS